MVIEGWIVVQRSLILTSQGLHPPSWIEVCVFGRNASPENKSVKQEALVKRSQHFVQTSSNNVGPCCDMLWPNELNNMLDWLFHTGFPQILDPGVGTPTRREIWIKLLKVHSGRVAPALFDPLGLHESNFCLTCPTGYVVKQFQHFPQQLEVIRHYINGCYVFYYLICVDKSIIIDIPKRKCFSKSFIVIKRPVSIYIMIYIQVSLNTTTLC